MFFILDIHLSKYQIATPLSSNYNKPRMLTSLADRYFRLLAENFPVMTGSDEFYYFPRLESRKADAESIDPDLIEEMVSGVRSLMGLVERAVPETIEQGIDRVMLTLSMNNFLFHFEELPLFRRDPTLYLRILIMGLDRSRFPGNISARDEREWVRSRLDSMARMIDSSRKNLARVPPLHCEIGIEMIRDVRAFLRDLRKDEFFSARKFEKGFSKIHDALELFKQNFVSMKPKGEASVGEELLRRILADNFGFSGSLEEARESIQKEIMDAEKILAREARKISKEKSPNELIEKLPHPVLDSRSILAAYRREVKRIRDFIIEHELIDLEDDPGVEVEFTPKALRSIRSAAAYAAPSVIGGVPGRYYILPVPRRPHTKEQKKRLKFIHRQCRFVTMHETYPGHHLIDLARLSNPNPVRRSIELPLVYEGWACYAESIPAGAGYFIDPAEALLLYKRRWWRAIRGLADISYQSGDASLEQAAQVLVKMGLDPGNAFSMIRRFALNPGYQMCYTLGTTGFYELHEKYAGKLGEREFHRSILCAGEATFKHACERLEELQKSKSGGTGPALS